MKTPSELIAAWLQHRQEIKSTRSKLGVEGYLYVCAILSAGPMTVGELGERTGLGKNAAYRFVGTLHRLGRLHVASWDEKPRSPLLPRFAFGVGVDAAPPMACASGRPRVLRQSGPRRALCAGLIAFEHLLRSFDDPCTRQDAVHATGFDQDTVWRFMETAVALDLAHVAAWYRRDHGGDPLPMVQMGSGRSVAKPTSRQMLRERWRRRAARLAANSSTAHLQRLAAVVAANRPEHREAA